MKDIVIYGCGGFGMEVAWLVEEINKTNPVWRILGYLDDDAGKRGQSFYGYPVLGDKDKAREMAGKAAIAIAVADPAPRRTIAERLAELDFEFPVLVHPSTVMSHSIEMGEGTIVAAGNILTVGIRIGKHVHINLDCTIGHRAIIEDYSTLFPSVNVSGDVCIRECASIGTGTQIIQDLEIGRNATIGAGSVVVRNVPPDVIAFGNPARVVRKKTP